MKKRKGIYTGINGRFGKNYKLTLIVLILIFSIIVVSGSVEKKSTESQESSGVNQDPKLITIHETENPEHTDKNSNENIVRVTGEGTQINSHPKEELKNRIENSESPEENSKPEIRETEQTDSYENTGNKQQSPGLKNNLQINTPDQENDNQNFEPNQEDNKAIKVLKDKEIAEYKTKQNEPNPSKIKIQKSTQNPFQVKESSEMQIEEQKDGDEQENEQIDKIRIAEQKTLTLNDRFEQKTEFTTEKVRADVVKEKEKAPEKPEEKSWFNKEADIRKTKEKKSDKSEQISPENNEYKNAKRPIEKATAGNSNENSENKANEESKGNLVSELKEESKLKQTDKEKDKLRQEKAPEDKLRNKEELEKPRNENKIVETNKKSESQEKEKDNLENNPFKNSENTQKDTDGTLKKEKEKVEDTEKIERIEETEKKDTTSDTNIWKNNEEKQNSGVEENSGIGYLTDNIVENQESIKKEHVQKQYFNEVSAVQNPKPIEDSQESKKEVPKNIEEDVAANSEESTAKTEESTAKTEVDYCSEILKDNPSQEPISNIYTGYTENIQGNSEKELERESETRNIVDYEKNLGSIIYVANPNIVSEEVMETDGDMNSTEDKDNEETEVKLGIVTEDGINSPETSPDTGEKETKQKPSDIVEKIGSKFVTTKALNSELEFKQETQKCNEIISQVPEKVCPVAEPRTCEVKTCNVTRLKNNETKPELKPEPVTEMFNWKCNPETQKPDPENKSEIKPDENSWQNLKFILSYSYALDSFYTIHDPIKIDYKGPETLGQQEVDIYLIKKFSPGFSKEALDETDVNKINLEELLNENTESYIQVPEMLNDNGDLSPLVFGPLPAGDYWAVVSIAGSEKEILLAKYFKVLEFEMGAGVQGSIKQGEDFEVKLELVDAPDEALENCTYWAVLISEKAYRANSDGSSSNIKIGIEKFLKNYIITGNSELNSTASSPMDSRSYKLVLNKAEFKDEIQNLIGEGNGAISIGEGNGNTLSITSLDLSPGNYLLFAGSFEDGKGLVGITQKKLTIYTPKKVSFDGDGDSTGHISSDNQLSITASSLIPENPILEAVEQVSIEEVKPIIKGAVNETVKIVKNPPKIPSFILGFIATLLTGLSIIKIRRTT
ncbi:MAG: TIGR04279 domain-containing protein [Methanosarcina sp.]